METSSILECSLYSQGRMEGKNVSEKCKKREISIVVRKSGLCPNSASVIHNTEKVMPYPLVCENLF